jgi:hypothetical protein
MNYEKQLLTYDSKTHDFYSSIMSQFGTKTKLRLKEYVYNIVVKIISTH